MIITIKVFETKLLGESNSRKMYQHLYNGKWYGPHKLKKILLSHNKSLEESMIRIASHKLEEYDLDCKICGDHLCMITLGKRMTLKVHPYCINCKTSSKHHRLIALHREDIKRNTIIPETGNSLSVEIALRRRDSLLKSDPDYYSKIGLKGYKNYLDTELKYQSSNEYNFLRYYDSLGKLDDVTNAPSIKNYYKRKIYFPDFYLISSNTIVEVKSWYVLYKLQGKNSNLKKFKRVFELGYNLLLVLDDAYESFSNYSEVVEFLDEYEKSLSIPPM